jgi:hypothetical protein
MQKVVGSSPISRSIESPAQAGFSVSGEARRGRIVSPKSAFAVGGLLPTARGHARKYLTLMTMPGSGDTDVLYDLLRLRSR